MFLPCLDGLLCEVATVIIWRRNLECHVGCPYLLPVCRQDIIVKDLLFWENSLVFYSVQCPASGQYHFYLYHVLHGFNPCGLSINFVQDDLISISLTRYVGELPCLIRVEIFFGFVDYQEKIALIFFFSQFCLTVLLCWQLVGAYFGGSHSLPLVLHVTLLGFFWFWEVLVEICHCD